MMNPLIDRRDIIEDLLKNVAPKFFDVNEVDQNRVSNFGYITESMAKSIEDTVNLNVTRSQNYIPELAASPTIIRETAKLREVGVNRATPSEAVAFLSVVKEDILSRGTADSNGVITFNIDRRSNIVNSNIYYSLISDIIIRAIPSSKGYIFSSSYSTETASYIQTYDGFVDNTPTLNMLVNIVQVKYNIQEALVVDLVEFTYSGLTFDYNNRLAGFDVYYRKGVNSPYSKIDTRYYLTKDISVSGNFLYYNDDQDGLVYILNNPTMDLDINTAVRIEVRETLGSEGAVSPGIGRTSFELHKDNAYNYAGVAVYAEIVDFISTGNNGDTLAAIKNNLIRAKIYRNNITTETDIVNYINDRDANIQIQKKRNDFIDRTYYLYTLLRNGADIVPAATKDLIIQEVDFDHYDRVTGIRQIKPYDKFLVKDDGMAHRTKDSNNDPNALCLPYLTILDSSNIPSFYFTTIKDECSLSALRNNEGNPFQAICRTVTIQRNQFKNSDTYRITTAMTLNTSNDSNIVGDDGKVIDTRIIKPVVLFKNDGQIAAYLELNFVSYDVESRVFIFSGEFTTDDFITENKKLHITSGMKAIRGTSPFTGVIDYYAGVLELHYFFKNSEEYPIAPSGDIIYTYAPIPDLVDYGYMNSFDNSEQPYNLLIELNNFVRSNVDVRTNGVTTYTIKEGDISIYTESNNFPVENFDYLRDSLIISLNGHILEYGPDYYIVPDGVVLRGRTVVPGDMLEYRIFKSFDDSTNSSFIRDRYLVRDTETKFKPNGYDPASDYLEVHIDKYGTLTKGLDYESDSTGYVTLFKSTMPGDVIEIQIFKNRSPEMYRIPMKVDDTYYIYNDSYRDVEIDGYTSSGYSMETDYVEIYDPIGRLLTKGVDYFILHHGRIRVLEKYIIDGSTLAVGVIKHYKGFRDIRSGFIYGEKDLVAVTGYSPENDYLELYHKEDVLVAGTDYFVQEDTSIRLLGSYATKAVELTYRLYKNIKYEMETIENKIVVFRGLYVASEKTDTIVVPNFNNSTDLINLYIGEEILFNGIDYRVSEDSSIIFKNRFITPGTEIRYEILKAYDVTDKVKVTDDKITVKSREKVFDVRYYEEDCMLMVILGQTVLDPTTYTVDEVNKTITLADYLDVGDVLILKVFTTIVSTEKLVEIETQTTVIDDPTISYIPLSRFSMERDTIMSVGYNQTQLVPDIDYITAINNAQISTYKISDGARSIAIPNLNGDKDFVRVLLNSEIILRDVHYTVSGNTITFKDEVERIPTDTVTVSVFTDFISGSIANACVMNVPVYTDGQKYVYVDSSDYLAAIYHNGLMLRPNIDYTYNSRAITLNEVPVLRGETLHLEYFKPVNPDFVMATSYYLCNEVLNDTVPNYKDKEDFLIVNLAGRILVPEVDYVLDGNTIIGLPSAGIEDGDIIHYTLIKGYNAFLDPVDGITIKGLEYDVGDVVSTIIAKPLDDRYRLISYAHSVKRVGSTIKIRDYDFSTDEIVVNYNQTILEEGEHYRKNTDNTLTFYTDIVIGDIFHFLIIKDVRKALNVETGYPKNPNRFRQLPEYNRDYDRVELVLGDKLMREYRDYTIDNLNRVIFKDDIRAGEDLYYQRFVGYYGNENGAFFMKLTEVPFIQYSYLKEHVEEIYDIIMNIKDTYSSLISLLAGFTINLKFTNTFGKSKHIFIEDEPLGNLNPVPKFKIYGRNIDVPKIKSFIINYFRNTYITDATIFISNICRAIETEFGEVRGVGYLGIDNFGAPYQKLFYQKPDLSTTEQTLAYVPECLNVINVNIELEEV